MNTSEFKKTKSYPKELIDSDLADTIKSLLADEQNYELVLKAALNNMTDDAISFWIDESLSKTGKTIWITADRTHLLKEPAANKFGWNPYPQVIPWENRSGSEAPYLWLIRLKDGRFITAEYDRGWKKWPDHKIEAFRSPSQACSLETLKNQKDFIENDWNPYPKFKPYEHRSYEVQLDYKTVRTSSWTGEKWSYFNARIIAFKRIE